jgi:RNA polymerase sigma factor (sigma-70 family)
MSTLLARRRRPGAPDPHDLVVRVVTQHADTLLRVARRHTTCAEDAQDAYQRALEVFVRRAHRLDPEQAHRWLHVVVRNEAHAVREARARLVGTDAEVLDALDDGRWRASLEERAEGRDDVARAAEALRSLKPQEVTALWLKAEGLSYAEIAERTGWSATKVNRCLTEGRRAFLARCAGIESGAECERWAPVLSAVVDGEASARELAAVRPHLRNCPGCRALLAELRRADATIGLVLPPALLAGLGAAAAAGGGAAAVTGGGAAVAAAGAGGGGALATGVGKLAAVAASMAALAGGGMVLEQRADRAQERRTPAAAAVPAPPPSAPAEAVAPPAPRVATAAQAGRATVTPAPPRATAPALRRPRRATTAERPRRRAALAGAEFDPAVAPASAPTAAVPSGGAGAEFDPAAAPGPAPPPAPAPAAPVAPASAGDAPAAGADPFGLG